MVSAVVTVLVRKKRTIIAGSLTLLAVFILGFLAATDRITWDGPPPNLSLGNKLFVAEYADTPEQQTKGLSGRKSIDERGAMVFRFANESEQCFWMKDMKFNIDIMWLDAGKKVVAIEKDVSPNSYPRSFCHQGQYVIELKAGTTDSIGLPIGYKTDLL